MATERVISSRVVGSSNPIAKKVRSISGSIRGVGCGFIMLIIGLVLIYQSVYGVKEYSKILAALPMQEASENMGNQDLVKVKGVIDVPVPVDFAYEKCANAQCFGDTTPEKTELSLYVSVDKQRFEIVEHVRTETRTRDVGGSEVEEEVEVKEYKEEWVSKEKKELWADFTLNGKVTVKGSTDTKLMIDTQEKEVANIKIDNLAALNYYGQQPSAQVGSTRLVYSFIPLSIPAPEYIVTGRLESNTIRSGDPFIITNMTESQLIKALGDEENFTRWAFAIGSWVLTFIGLSMLMAPIIELVDWIPLFGWAAKAAAAAIAFVIATVLVLGSWLILKFWWLILLLTIALIALAIFLVAKKRKPEAAKE
jgi:hypothetical protein